MKLLTFEKNNLLHLGIKTEKGVLDVAHAATELGMNKMPLTIGSVIEGGADALSKLNILVDKGKECDHPHVYLDEEGLEFGPCVPNPGKIVCVGLNYKKHVEESNMPIPETPVLFNKFNNTITAHRKTIFLPHNSKEVDYEAELVIVIGKKAKRVPKEAALDYVFGYCAVNELSARDLQMLNPQWLAGKSCDDFSPVGPYLVSKDEVPNPNNLQIKTYLNGELRQNSNTSDMIFNCETLISYISDHMTLDAGDIIMTGTPEGVILGYPEDEREYLKKGDKVVVEIDSLGTLINTFDQEI